MERHIVHLDIAAFGVAVEEVREPRLRGRPVVIGVPGAPRATVRCASLEAYRAGIRKGMPLVHARRWCRDLVVVPPDEPLYRTASRSVYELLGEFSPLVEPASYGHLFVDMSGTRRLFGAPRDAGAKMRREIASRLLLQGTVGIAANKLVSRVAAKLIQPEGDVCEVVRGSEAAFLAPLQVRLLPGLRQGTEEVLVDELNVRLIRQLAGIPVGYLAVVFGRFAPVLHQWAVGIDCTPVRPPRRAPAIVEGVSLAEDTNDDRCLLAELYAMTERAARRLRSAGVVARQLVLTVRYADHVERVRRTWLGGRARGDRCAPGTGRAGGDRRASGGGSVPGGGRTRVEGRARVDGRVQMDGRVRMDGRARLDTGGCDETTILDMHLFRHVESLFFQACDRRQRVRHLSIVLTDLVAPDRQLDLFASTLLPSARQDGVQRDRELITAIDRIRDTYGVDAVRRGRVL
jgi:DNA polymerase-4